MDLIDARFRPVAVVSRGANTETLRVVDRRRGSEVVLKTVTVSEDRRPQAARRLEHEFRLLSRLRHPNLVRPYDYGALDDGRPYYTREWLGGRRLVATLPGPVPFGALCGVLEQLLRLLTFLHARRLLVRELCPQDLVLREDGTVVLVDLGAVEQFGLLSDGSITGALTYLAPEVPLGEALDARTDLYTLGCLGYELATGAPLFPGREGLELVRAHLWEKPVAPRARRPELPEAFSALLERLVAKEPQDRYPDALGALEALGAACGFAVHRPDALAPRGYLHAAHLVGREDDVAAIRRALADAAAGRAAGLVFAAPAGLGKTRLLRETQLLAQLEGFWCGAGACRDCPSVAYAPWLEVLRPLAAWAPPEDAALVRLLDARAAPLSPAAPRFEKLALFDAVARWLARAAARQPLALLLDDVHLADFPSAELLDYLLRELRGARVLLAAAYRPDELPSYGPLRQALDERMATVVAPAPLTREGVARMVSGMLGCDAIAPEVLEVIDRDAGGNPFFVFETLRALVDAGWVDFRERRWVLRGPVDEVPPAGTIEATVRRRFARLAEPVPTVARAAAVAGDPLDAALLREVTGLDDAALADALDELLERQFVFLLHGGYYFVHANTRTAILATLAPEAQRALHGAVGAALERRAGVAPAVLGYHFALADDLARGTRYLAEAADQAVAHDNVQDAYRFLQRALALQGAHGEPDPAFADRLRERIAQLAWIAEPPLALAMLLEVLARAPAGREHVAQLQGMVGVAYAFQGQLGEAREWTERALQQLEDRDSPVYASVLVSTAIVAMTDGSFDECEAQLRRAREIFRRHAELPGMAAERFGATNYIDACRTLRGLPALASPAEASEQVLRDYRYPGVPDAYDYIFAAYDALTGRYHAFLPRFERAARTNRLVGHPPYRESVQLQLLTVALLERGELEGALAEGERLLALTRRAGNQMFASCAEALIGRVLAERDGPEAHVERVERAAEAARGRHFLFFARILTWLAEVYMMLDRWEQAGAVLREAYDVSGPGPYRNPAAWVVACRLLARCERHAGRSEEAWRFLREGLALAVEADNLVQLGHLHLEAAELSRADGRAEDACLHRRLARSYFERIDNPHGLALVAGEEAFENCEAREPEGAVARLDAMRAVLRSAQARGVLAERMAALGSKVERALAEARQARRLLAIAEFSKILAGSHEIDAVAGHAVSQVHELAGASRTVLRLFDGAGGFSLERARPDAGPADPVRESAADAAVAEGRLVQREEPAPAHGRAVGWRPRSVLALPLRSQDRAIGVLVLERSAFQPPFSEEDRAILASLATYAGVALESALLLDEMGRRVRERTAQVEAANRELEAFSYSVSHDLRAPLRTIDGFSQAVLDDFGALLPAEGHEHLRRVRAATQRMAQLIDDLLTLSRVSRTELARAPVDLSALARAVASTLEQGEPARRVEWVIPQGLSACGDARLLRVALENLLGNAWKFTGRCAHARIELGAIERDGQRAFFVRDNGAGFDMARVGKLFVPFQRLHSPEEFPGSGVGLATVQRVVHRHGGRIWAESGVDQGATFYFTL